MKEHGMEEKETIQETESTQIVDQKTEQENKKKKRKRLILLLLILLLLLGFGGCRAWKYFTEEKPFIDMQKELDAEIGLMPGMTEDEIQDRLNRHVAEGRFNASMNGHPIFPDGNSKGNVNIENIPGNRYAFSVSIQVTNVDASLYPDAAAYIGQTVLQTGLLEPNSFLSEKKLSVALPKGEYDCLATFTAYKSEKDANGGPQEEIGATAMQIVISVQK